MKISRMLLWAGVAVAAGLLLTRTEKGKELGKNFSRKANDLTKKLKNVGNRSEEYLSEVVDDAKQMAQKARQKADGQMV